MTKNSTATLQSSLVTEFQIEELRILIEKCRPRYGTFEKEILLPEVIERLDYVLEVCTKIKTMCQDTQVHYQLGLVFQKMVTDGTIPPDPNNSDPAKTYFDSVIAQLDRDFIPPLQKLLTELKEKQIDYETDQLAHLFNKSSNLFQIFVGLKEKLFHYSAGAFISAKLKDGTIKISTPVEIDIIVMPFKNALDEVSNISEKTIESIKLWGRSLLESKKQFIDLVIKTSENNTAKTELANTQRNFHVQLLIAGIALILIVLGYFGNLLLENRALSKGIDTREAELNSCRDEVKLDSQKIEAFKDQISQNQREHK